MGGRPATVLRVDTTARLSIEVPPADSPGTADLEVRRAGDAATLAGCVRYAPRHPPDIDLVKAPAGAAPAAGRPPERSPARRPRRGRARGRGDEPPPGRGPVRDLGPAGSPGGAGSPADRPRRGRRRRLQPGLGRGGADLAVPGPRRRRGRRRDGRPGHPVGGLGHGRLRRRPAPARRSGSRTSLPTRLGAQIVRGIPEFCCSRVAGGGDLRRRRRGRSPRRDGTTSSARRAPFGSSSAPGAGRGSRPSRTCRGSGATWRRTPSEDAVAIARDVDGDGRDELLIGAPGRFWSDDGNGYLVRGGLPLASERVEDLVEAGAAARFDAFKARTRSATTPAPSGTSTATGSRTSPSAPRAAAFEFAGESYVIFGGRSLFGGSGANVLSMRELGARGVRIPGDVGYDYSDSIEPAGDFNGDGLADLLISRGPHRYHAEGLRRLRRPGEDRRAGRLRGGGPEAPVSGPGLRRHGRRRGLRRRRPRRCRRRRDEDPGRHAERLHRLRVDGRPAFLRGDASGDGEVVISDAIFALGYLFLGGDAPPCDDAADANDDGTLEITDAIYILSPSSSEGRRRRRRIRKLDRTRPRTRWDAGGT